MQVGQIIKKFSLMKSSGKIDSQFKFSTRPFKNLPKDSVEFKKANDALEDKTASFIQSFTDKKITKLNNSALSILHNSNLSLDEKINEIYSKNKIGYKKLDSMFLFFDKKLSRLKKSNNPEVIELKNAIKKRFDVDVYSNDNLSFIKLVAEALLTLEEAGYNKFPKNIRMSNLFTKMNPDLAGLAVSNSLSFSTSRPWGKSEELAKLEYNTGNRSSDHPAHLIFHELTHWLQEQKIGFADAMRQAETPIPNCFKDVIEEYLSSYAVTNKSEFVAETGALVLGSGHGHKFFDILIENSEKNDSKAANAWATIRNLYEEYKGP